MLEQMSTETSKTEMPFLKNEQNYRVSKNGTTISKDKMGVPGEEGEERA